MEKSWILILIFIACAAVVQSLRVADAFADLVDAPLTRASGPRYRCSSRPLAPEISHTES